MVFTKHILQTKAVDFLYNSEKSREREMGLLTNRVERSEIKPGDHIYTYRAVFAYSHHGYKWSLLFSFYFFYSNYFWVFVFYFPYSHLIVTFLLFVFTLLLLSVIVFHLFDVLSAIFFLWNVDTLNCGLYKNLIYVLICFFLISSILCPDLPKITFSLFFFWPEL